MKKKFKEQFENSALFRHVTSMATLIGSLMAIGAFAFILIDTKFTNKTEFKSLVNRADTMQAKYRLDQVETKWHLAVMGSDLEKIEEKQKDAKVERKEIRRDTRKILMAVKK